MTHFQTLPGWVALLVAALVLAGALLTCIGSVGLVRMANFYRRVHAPTLGTTLGMFLVVAGAIVFFSVDQGSAVLHPILIGAFITVTTPITLMLLARAAIARDMEAGLTDLPPVHRTTDADEDGDAQP